MSGIVWLASYPKSGNTWLRVVLANLRAQRAAPVDINELNTTQFGARELWDRAIGWETAELLPEECEALRLPVQERLAQQAPEIPIKTHEVFADPRDARPRFSLRATRCALYVLRNPLDVAVSLSHFRGEEIDASIAFMNDPRAELKLGPHATDLPQMLCDWSAHVKSWVDAPGLPVCVLRYEDMLAAPEEAFGRAAAAAGIVADAAQIARAVEHSRFEALQRQEREKGFAERAAGRAFFRAGRAGEGRARLNPEQVAAIVRQHGAMMRRFGYLDAAGAPSDVRAWKPER